MSHNTWIHRAVRVAVRPLAAGPITPNQVTTLRLAVGLGAPAFAVFMVVKFRAGLREAE